MSTNDTANWPEILRAVALEVLGQPTERRGDEWRYGRRGSLVVNVGGRRAGTWRDFEAGRGGGALEMLRHYQGLDKPQALDWLRSRGSCRMHAKAGQAALSNLPRRAPLPEASQGRKQPEIALWAS